MKSTKRLLVKHTLYNNMFRKFDKKNDKIADNK